MVGEGGEECWKWRSEDDICFDQKSYMCANLKDQVKQISLSFAPNNIWKLKISFQMQKQCEHQSDIKSTAQVEKHQLLTQNTFFSLHRDFKFRIAETLNPKRQTCVFNGFLVYNNGQTVYINPIHQGFVHSILNPQANNKINKIVYSVDPNIQTLSFSSKVGSILTLTQSTQYRTKIYAQLLEKKKIILALLAALGSHVSSENQFMKKLLLQKRNLKKQLEVILSKDKNSHQANYLLLKQKTRVQVEPQIQAGVIYYGQNTNYQLHKSQQKMTEQQSQTFAAGGYFKIQNSHCKVIHTGTNKAIGSNLVLKSLKQQRKGENKTSLTVKKMYRQVEIVNMIKDKRYLINYYVQKNKESMFEEIYMDKCQYSLYDYLYFTDQALDLRQRIIIAKQIVESVILLHQSQVIHRDIKPANFLVQDKIVNNKINIKIIDFAESYSDNMSLKQGSFGCSHPYSPFDCTQKRKIVNGKGQQGLSRVQIDYWSVGVTIFELFFKKLPISYSKAYLIEVIYTWRSDMLSLMDQRQKIGVNLVYSVIEIMCLKMMKIKLQERLNLYMALQILRLLEKYVQSLFKMFYNN